MTNDDPSRSEEGRALPLTEVVRTLNRQLPLGVPPLAHRTAIRWAHQGRIPGTYQSPPKPGATFWVEDPPKAIQALVAQLTGGSGGD